MRTLTEVFAPETPTLPEGLRTLAVSPERELEPGVTVRASFRFRNQGGANASGVRVRFNVPDGLVYLVGSGMVDGAALEDEQGNSPLLARGGAHIGDVAPAEERRIEIAYSVAGAIENGSIVELQAAVAAFELAPVGSNIVRLVVRSRPQLANALSTIGIEARREPVPGAEATVTVRVHNAGESSARHVAVLAPIPEHTSYVANSARVNGRDIEREVGASFDRSHAPVITATLPASGTATLLYRVRLDEPLEDGTHIVAGAQIASQETAPFALAPSTLVVHAAPHFSDDRTVCSVEPAHDVTPGTHVAIKLNATNAGSTTARRVSVALELGAGLLATRGSGRIDGRPVRERKKEAMQWDVGDLDAGDAAQWSIDVIVTSPVADGLEIPVAVSLAWDDTSAEGGRAARRFQHAVRVHSLPLFPVRRNSIERIGPATVRPAEEIEALIAIANEGSAPATDVVLQLHADPALEDLRISEKSGRLTLSGDSVELETLEPYAARRMTVRARVRSPYADRSDIALRASLHTQELGESPLGEARWSVSSQPAFVPDSSLLTLRNDDLLRPNQLADVFVALRNVGTDAAQNVRLQLYVSPEARLESVEGATRDRVTLFFGELAAGARAEARLGLRLQRSLAKEYPVTVDGVLAADGMLPVQMNRLTIATTAEPDFSVGVLHAEPSDTIDVGELVEYTLYVRNGGDGPARRVSIRVDHLDALTYVPNSTTVNDVSLRDVGARSPLFAEGGMILNEVDAGVEAMTRWREAVHNGLPAGESIVRTARVGYDGDREDTIASAPLKVRAAPAFASSIAGLPFGLDGMLGPSLGSTAPQRVLSEAEQYVQLPPAQPVEREGYWLQAVTGFVPLQSNGSAHAEAAHSHRTIEASLTFTRERLERTVRFLDEARFGGLVTHLFAIRAFLPDAIGDVNVQSLGSVRETLRESLDRLFIKLRLPNYAIAPRDIETPASRAALERFLHDVVGARGRVGEAPEGALTVWGDIDADEMAQAAVRVQAAALGTAAPWLALARTLGDVPSEMLAYRHALCGALDELVDADSAAFMETLRRGSSRVLDDALENVREVLSAVRA